MSLVLKFKQRLCLFRRSVAMQRASQLAHSARHGQGPGMRAALVHISLASTLHLSWFADLSDGNPSAKRLYDDLLNNYNRLIRPVGNNTEKLTVWLKLKLSQLIDVVRLPVTTFGFAFLSLFSPPVLIISYGDFALLTSNWDVWDDIL